MKSVRPDQTAGAGYGHYTAKKPAEYQDIIRKHCDPVPAGHHIVPAGEDPGVSSMDFTGPYSAWSRND